MCFAIRNIQYYLFLIIFLLIKFLDIIIRWLIFCYMHLGTMIKVCNVFEKKFKNISMELSVPSILEFIQVQWQH